MSRKRIRYFAWTHPEAINLIATGPEKDSATTTGGMPGGNCFAAHSTGFFKGKQFVCPGNEQL